MKVVAEDATTQKVQIESKISTDTLIPWDSSLTDKTSTIYQQKSEEVQTAFIWRLTSAGAARGLTLTEILVDFSSSVRKRRSAVNSASVTVTAQYTARVGDTVDLNSISDSLNAAVKSAADTAIKSTSEIFQPTATVTVSTNAALEKLINVDLIFMISLNTELTFTDSLKNKKSQDYLDSSKIINALLTPAVEYVSTMNSLEFENQMTSFTKLAREKRDSDQHRNGLHHKIYKISKNTTVIIIVFDFFI